MVGFIPLSENPLFFVQTEFNGFIRVIKTSDFESFNTTCIYPCYFYLFSVYFDSNSFTIFLIILPWKGFRWAFRLRFFDRGWFGFWLSWLLSFLCFFWVITFSEFLFNFGDDRWLCWSVSRIIFLNLFDSMLSAILYFSDLELYT